MSVILKVTITFCRDLWINSALSDPYGDVRTGSSGASVGPCAQ